MNSPFRGSADKALENADGDWISAMRAGEFERAWSITDRDVAVFRHDGDDKHKGPRHQQRIWRGEELRNRRVLVRCYHGLGDTIQFARFLPLLGERVRELTVWCQPELLPLIGRLEGVDRAIPLHDWSGRSATGTSAAASRRSFSSACMVRKSGSSRCNEERLDRRLPKLGLRISARRISWRSVTACRNWISSSAWIPWWCTSPERSVTNLGSCCIWIATGDGPVAARDRSGIPEPDCSTNARRRVGKASSRTFEPLSSTEIHAQPPVRRRRSELHRDYGSSGGARRCGEGAALNISYVGALQSSLRISSFRDG